MATYLDWRNNKMNVLYVKDIQEKLQLYYDKNIWHETRKLYIHKNYDSYSKIGSIFFSLQGSPPKGYGIYITEFFLLNLYDGQGRRFRIIKDCIIDDIGDFKDNDILEGLLNVSCLP